MAMTRAWSIGAALALALSGTAAAQPSPAYEEGFRAGVADERRAAEFPGGATWRLDLARDLLRETLVILRRAPSGPRRDEALAEARAALIATQNAMTWAPRDGRGMGPDARERGIHSDARERGIHSDARKRAMPHDMRGRVEPGSLEHGWGERASAGPRG